MVEGHVVCPYSAFLNGDLTNYLYGLERGMCAQIG